MKLYTACFFTHCFSYPAPRSQKALYMIRKARGRDGYFIKWDFAYRFPDKENHAEFIEADSEREAVRKFTERRLDWAVVDWVTIQRVSF